MLFTTVEFFTGVTKPLGKIVSYSPTKLFWPTVRKTVSDWEKLWKFDYEDLEFAKKYIAWTFSLNSKDKNSSLAGIITGNFTKQVSA